MSTIKTMVRGAYDIQQLRIQMGNRIVMNFKAKLGQEPSQPDDFRHPHSISEPC
jgi:hypothetical protein